MESVETTKKKIPSKKKVQTESLRVHRSTKKTIYSDLAKINRKDFGRKVRTDSYIKLAISKLTESDFKALQNESLTQADRLELKYRDHVKKHGQVSKDQFIGILLDASELPKVASVGSGLDVKNIQGEA
jgi:hypothetical protein